MASYEQRDDPRGLRRLIVGFSLGVLFAAGPFFVLLFRGDRIAPMTWPAAAALFLSFVVCAPIAIFSAFSWALFYRCPRCRRRLRRLKREPLPDDCGYSLKYVCHDCHIEWNVFWQERSNDDDGGA